MRTGAAGRSSRRRPAAARSSNSVCQRARRRAGESAGVSDMRSKSKAERRIQNGFERIGGEFAPDGHIAGGERGAGAGSDFGWRRNEGVEEDAAGEMARVDP